MNAKRILLALGTVAAVTGVSSVPAAYAGYPFKCPKNKAVLADDQIAGSHVEFTSIQAAVNAAMGTPTSGDTVLVCPGTFYENVSISGPTKSNVTVRSWDDTNESKIVGSGTGPVVSISAPGVTLGGPGLGLTITGPANTVGVYVGTNNPIHTDEDDDQPYPDCPQIPEEPDQCADKETPPFATTNVNVVGNRIIGLRSATTNVSGILVQSTNNTLVFRNLVSGLAVGAGARAAGVVFNQTNYNPQVLGNAFTNLSQTGGNCGTADAGAPSNGAVGVSIEDEALDALVYDTIVDKVSATCAAVGVFSNAWGGLENDRNGQQVPIATDLVDNRIKHVRGRDGGSSSGVVLNAVAPDTKDDESPVSSFRVLANDIDDTNIAVDVQGSLAPNSMIRENDLDTDAIGVNNESANEVDATNNWWGCEQGPRAADNPYSTGKKECAAVVGDVTYNPWTKHHIDHAGAHAGEYAGHN